MIPHPSDPVVPLRREPCIRHPASRSQPDTESRQPSCVQQSARRQSPPAHAPGGPPSRPRSASGRFQFGVAAQASCRTATSSAPLRAKDLGLGRAVMATTAAPSPKKSLASSYLSLAQQYIACWHTRAKKGSILMLLSTPLFLQPRSAFLLKV